MLNSFSLENYDFLLPKERIRQTPPVVRSDCRLMILNKSTISNSSFPKLLEIVEKEDVMIFNRTRVRKSLVYGNKVTGGKLEINFLKKREGGFLALIKGRIKDGDAIEIGSKLLKVDTDKEGFRVILGEIDWNFIEKIGHLPLPPYIKERGDFQYYQNEIGNDTNSVAAPTATLHFSKDMLDALNRKGVKTSFILLDVGYGTYKEIKDECIRKHIVDEEEIDVPEDVISQLENAREKIIAVGTTVMRALETSSFPGNMRPYRGSTRIFIYPGWKFNSPVSHLITNFHIPRSSLLSLVYAFGGEQRIKEAYKEAIDKGYYFYSLGDAMIMDKSS